MLAVYFNAVSAVTVLLLLMLVGYLMGRVGWMGKSEKKFLGQYIMNVAVPCNCVVGILNNLDRSMLAETGMMVFSVILSTGCCFLLGIALATLLKLPRKQWGVFVPMVGLSNCLFIGVPLTTQLFGEVCLPYVMTYYLANTMFTQSVAVMLVEYAGSVSSDRTPMQFVKGVVTKPPIVALFVSVMLLLADIRPPEVVMNFSKYISNSVSSLALIYCGYIVYELGFKNIRLQRGLPTMLICRLVAAPVVCVLFCKLFGITGLAHDVFIVESALPVVSQITVMAGNYGADDKYSATGATLSTIGCFFTIPVLMVLLG
jgi:predicted permease